MYLEFYNLKEKPFSLTPDPAFLFYSNSHRRAVAFLRYGLQESKGFLQLTGPVGSGKTTLLRAVLSQLDERTRTAYIINPCASFPDLLRSIMRDLEIPNIPQTRLKIELLDFFHDYLLVQTRRSQPVVVIFDEAQNLSAKNLEEIRMLSNFETTKEKLVHIVFVGQPELIKLLDSPDLRQLKQRIQVRYHLSPLRLPEIKAYIDHRLHVAGSDGGIVFSEEACKAIYDFSGGIPRLINSVCDVMLLIGYVNERREFDGASVVEAIGEMNGSFANDAAAADNEPGAYGSGSESREEGRLSGRQEPSTPEIDAPPPKAEPCEIKTGQILEPDRERTKPAPGAGISLSGNRAASDEARVEDAISMSETGSSPHENADDKEPVSVDEAGDESRGTSPEFLHSLLRHGRTRKFRAAGAGAIRLEESPKDIRSRISHLVKKKAARERDGGSLAMEEKERTADGATDQRGMSAQFSHGPVENPAGKTATAGSSSVVLQEKGDDTAADLREAEPAKDENSRVSPVSTARRIVYPKKAPNRHKTVAFLKNGKVERGYTTGLDTKEAGFGFSRTEANGSGEEFVSFLDTIAVCLVDDFEGGWRNDLRASGSSPKGRQIVVALENGMIIEGITLDGFDPECERFFVISTNRQGHPIWTLVEKSGATGILTDNFCAGIYQNKAVRLADSVASKPKDDPAASQHETSGDMFFSFHDYDAALLEYEKSWETTADPRKLALKVSLCHFQRGIKHMKSNRYRDAQKDFEKVVAKVIASPYLREKARSKLKEIDRMRGD